MHHIVCLHFCLAMLGEMHDNMLVVEVPYCLFYAFRESWRPPRLPG